jgi:hypothetical protein
MISVSPVSFFRSVPLVSAPSMRRNLVPLLLVPLVLFFFVRATSAHALGAEAPRWKIVATTDPTHIAPGSPANEVQQLTVNATGGTFTISPGIVPDRCAVSAVTPAIPYNASAAEVQTALGEACEFLEGRVTVTGGPVGKPATVNNEPYTITFTGKEPGEEPGAGPLAGLLGVHSGALAGSATVKEVTKGQYIPQLVVTATNVGGASTDGSTITMNDVLPTVTGLTATGIEGWDAYHSGFVFFPGTASSPMSCLAPPTLTCTYAGKVDPGDILVMTINLAAEPSAPVGTSANHASVEGGGALEASTTDPVDLSSVPAGFGPDPSSVFVEPSTTQAGAHANVTTAFTLNTKEAHEAVGNVKDVHADLPPGLVGNTVGLPRCVDSKIIEELEHPEVCPTDTVVGMAVVTLAQAGANGRSSQTIVAPVFNIAPAPGEPAAFAFNAFFFPVRLDTSVLSNGNYGVRVSVAGISQAAVTLSSWVTIWGVPADHNGPGGDLSFYNVVAEKGSFGGPNPGQTRVPLLSDPQQCGPLLGEISADSWASPGVFASSGPVAMEPMTGCEQLSLESSFSMLPDTLQAGVPAGYVFDLNVPQHNDPEGLASPDVKDVRLMLPAGVVVNPSAATGLKACSDAQFFGPSRGKQEPASLGECPREAQIGKVRVKSPALEEALEGQVYLAEPECNPCTPEDAQDGKMIRLFLQVVSEGEGGIVVKLAGKGSIDQQTGQITTTFENNPQLPFDSLKLELGGGPRATLANPRKCGSVASNLDLTPWSAPFTPDSTPSYGFEINQNCFGPQFNPSFVAGLTNLQAGEYGPFTLAFGRSDQDQFIGGLELKTPPGLLGSLAHVPLCPEPQASQGTCGPQSLIGHTQVLTGPGADPFLVSGGQVFLTEGYKGAPFGLSIVVPAVAGPYTLAGTTGHGTVVVRAQILIDPNTAALTVKSDPLPSVLDGIPLQLKVVNVTIDRPEFMFGPTNCSKLQITGTLASTEGTSAPAASPFQVTNCASLRFKPKFTVSTSGRTSKENGASLNVKLTYPNEPQGAEANIHSVKVDLPKQLPSRLTTLQKACTAVQFEANPAGCPAASIVGHAKATTPLLPVPVEGPAYFVSHGGEAFPSLILVLQGYGVTVDLVGTTFISKAGITSSTFKTVPDVPVGSFELTLPQGRFSALTANGNLCRPTKIVTVRKRVPRRVHGRVVHVLRPVKRMVAQPLVMPTGFVAQNGAQFTQMTKIAVTGCTTNVQKKRKSAKKASAHRRGKDRAARRS